MRRRRPEEIATGIDGGLRVEFLPSLQEIDPAEWDALGGRDYPFLRHDFLLGLERSGCTTAESGWQPCHLVLRDNDRAQALLPLYIKSHSWGEYVFDWSWAQAWERSGLDYYPKLVSAIPFTPASGPRLCTDPSLGRDLAWDLVLDAVRALSRRGGFSSWHLLFPPEEDTLTLLERGVHRRCATQFHWYNRGYTDFDDFLGDLNSRKRKAIRRERRRVAEQGIRLRTLVGSEIGEGDWARFYRFYQGTYAKRSGHGGYLSRAFFSETAPAMGGQVIMVVADREGRAVGGSLFFRSGDTLFGRYWGCEREYDCLHFEACYYQGIEFCIRHKVGRFDPGAQGEHKIQRGFRPVRTWSSHWIADPALSAAVGDFTRREAAHIEGYLRETEALLPFRSE